MNVCPVKAISRDEQLGRVSIDYDACVGVCPFGAMSFNTIDKQVFKCDLCDGDPQCVRFCDVKAVELVEADEVSISKRRMAAQKLSHAR